MPHQTQFFFSRSSPLFQRDDMIQEENERRRKCNTNCEQMGCITCEKLFGMTKGKCISAVTPAFIQSKVQWMECFKMKNIISRISNKKHKGIINYSSLSFTSDPQGDCRETLLKNKPMMMIYATLPLSFYRSYLPSCSKLLEEF